MSRTRRDLILGTAPVLATVLAAAGPAVATSPGGYAPEIAGNPFRAIRGLDYTVIFARDLTAMRRFYETVLGFAVYREIAGPWIELRVGSQILALTRPGLLFGDPVPATGVASLQLAFRLTAAQVNACADHLRAAGVAILGEPTDQPWGHRTLFFRDPDGNILEVYADIRTAG